MEAEYDGGFDVDRDVLGWVLIGVGAAAMITGIMLCAKGARKCIVANRAANAEMTFDNPRVSLRSEVGAKTCHCSYKTTIACGIASLIPGAGCALGGSTLLGYAEYIGIHI